MRWWALAGGAVGALALIAGLGLALPTDLPPLRPDELASIGSLGPWPPPAARDPSNRVSGRAEAAALGEALFHTTRLSTVGGLRCASCHAPWRRFTDGRARALGAEDGARNTPSLLNVRLQHWFGWDGGNDSLWSQSIRPMLDAREMRADAAHVARALRDDETLKRLYALAFGQAPPADDETALVDAGKALAAYQETLASERTPFDVFRDALVRGDGAAAERYPVAAQRGLRLFVGRGQCIACHAGPNFSDGEFHRSRIASKLHDGSRRRWPRARRREAAGQRLRAQRPLRRRDPCRSETRIAAGGSRRLPHAGPARGQRDGALHARRQHRQPVRCAAAACHAPRPGRSGADAGRAA